jgi:RHS repeat-associated protein
VILRDKDNDSGWANPADGSLEQRHYYCQNWRYDVIAMVSNTGKIIERCRYFANGQPFSSPSGDTNFDGLVGSADQGNVLSWYSSYNVAGDFDLDGDVDAGDLAEVTANWGTTAHGFGKLSNYTSGYNGNRKGYAGYEYDFTLQGRSQFWHVRHRVFSSELGRWLQRDAIETPDSPNRYAYVLENPSFYTDPDGQQAVPVRPAPRPAVRPRVPGTRRLPEYPGFTPTVPVEPPPGTPRIPYVDDEPIWTFDPDWKPYWGPPGPEVGPMPGTAPKLTPQEESERRRRWQAERNRYGNCEPDEWRPLYLDISKKCKSGIIRSCRGFGPGQLPCDEIQRRIDANQACLDARWKLIDQCYGGRPNKEHETPLRETEAAISTCKQLFYDSNCGNGGLYGPTTFPIDPHLLPGEGEEPVCPTETGPQGLSCIPGK